MPTATPQKSPTKPEKPPAETKTASAEKPAKEEEEEKPRAVTKAPEPAKKSAPKPHKAEWSPPNAKKPEGKRSRSPLATNRATSDASKEKTRPRERKVTSTTTRPVGRVSAPGKPSTAARPVGGVSEPSSTRPTGAPAAKKRPTGMSEDKVHRQMFDKRGRRPLADGRRYESERSPEAPLPESLADVENFRRPFVQHARHGDLVRVVEQAN